MGTTTGRLTVEEYLALPEEQIAHTELIDGEIVQMSVARLGHEIVKASAAEILLAWRSARRGFTVLIESGYRLAPRTALQPDVSVIVRPQAKQAFNEVPSGAPVVAVEVVSSDEADRLEQKIAMYLSRGTQGVWVLYPNHKALYVHRADRVKRLASGDTLESEVLPGFSVPIDAFFQDLV